MNEKSRRLSRALPALLLALGAVAAVPGAHAGDEGTSAPSTDKAAPAGAGQGQAMRSKAGQPDQTSSEKKKKKHRSANPCAVQ